LYPQKTCKDHENWYVSKEQYQFNKLEIVSRSTMVKYWNAIEERWCRRCRTVVHGVNSKSNMSNKQQCSIDTYAENVKGYDAFDFVHW